ncbi:MAG: hypothetical protein ACR2PT_16850 [Endozoicomonas sp.]
MSRLQTTVFLALSLVITPALDDFCRLCNKTLTDDEPTCQYCLCEVVPTCPSGEILKLYSNVWGTKCIQRDRIHKVLDRFQPCGNQQSLSSCYCTVVNRLYTCLRCMWTPRIIHMTLLRFAVMRLLGMRQQSIRCAHYPMLAYQLGDQEVNREIEEIIARMVKSALLQVIRICNHEIAIDIESQNFFNIVERYHMLSNNMPSGCSSWQPVCAPETLLEQIRHSKQIPREQLIASIRRQLNPRLDQVRQLQGQYESQLIEQANQATTKTIVFHDNASEFAEAVIRAVRTALVVHIIYFDEPQGHELLTVVSVDDHYSVVSGDRLLLNINSENIREILKALWEELMAD